MYALVFYALKSFTHLFIRSLIKVHRSSFTTYALFFPVFIHRILLHLGLDEFSASELVHIIAPIGATFLRQRAAPMRASFKCPRVKSSSGVASLPPPPPPFSTGDLVIDAYVDPTAAVAHPPSTSDDSDIHRMLETIMTVQAAHGQLLVDVLTELHVLHAELGSFRKSPPPPPFDDE